MANFDPFGKYVMVQLLNNSLELFDARTLEKVKVINLAETKNDLPTKGDRRTADWSPEFSYFVCPNLNDARVPTAVILDRTRSFGIKDILIGHQSTISCCKFNPNIY
jgi:WD40 repeat protein